jgi:hypothetical protein
MSLPGLDEFVTEQCALLARGRGGRGRHVEEPGFSELYIRVGAAEVNGVFWNPILQLANLEAEQPGQGAFRRLLERLRENYSQLPILVEGADARFGRHLLSVGFQQVQALEPAAAGGELPRCGSYLLRPLMS